MNTGFKQLWTCIKGGILLGLQAHDYAGGYNRVLR